MKRVAFFLLALLAAGTLCAASVTVSLTVTPTSSAGPIAPTLTWTSTGAGACTASDGWSGAKPVNGTELAAAVSKTTKFTLTCSSPTGPATLSWTPPTTNSDGTPLTNLSGYQIMSGPSASALARNTLIGAPASTATLQSTPGLMFFSVRSERADGAESIDSNTVSRTVVADTAVGSVTLTVAVVPNPPTNLTVQ